MQKKKLKIKIRDWIVFKYYVISRFLFIFESKKKSPYSQSED